MARTQKSREPTKTPVEVKVAYIGLIGAVVAAIITLIVGLGAPISQKIAELLFAPTATPTPTKTPIPVLSPTITDTPTLTLVPSPTPTPTPYYVEIVVDASERMSAKFEGGTTKMESAWQTTGTIASIRAQQGQFVTVRLFGGRDSPGDGSCKTSYSLFDFTNDDQQITNYLAESPTSGGEAAVVRALLDAAKELNAYEHIGREIILLTGGDDECNVALSAFYNSANQALWTQTFVVLFSDEEFGPFTALETQGANIYYDLVRNRAEAEAVADKVAAATPPVPITMVPTLTFPPPPPTTGGEPRPTSTPKPPSPPTGGTAPATRPPTPTATQSPTYTSTPTDTPTPTKTAVPPTNTPTKPIIPTNTPTDMPIPTFTPTSTPYVLFTNLESGQEVQTDFTCGFILQGQAQGGMSVRVIVHTDGPYEQGAAPVQGNATWELNIYLGGRCDDYRLHHTVAAELLDAGEQVVATYQVEHVKRTVECSTPLKLESATVCKVDAQYEGENVIYLREQDYQCFINPASLMVTAQNYSPGSGTVPSVAIGNLAATSMYTRTECTLSMRYPLRQQLGIDESEMGIWPVTARPHHRVWLTPLQ